MHISPTFFGFLAFFFLVPLAGLVRAQDTLPLPPSDYDSKAKTPSNLPKALKIPTNMRIEVQVWRKKPIHYPSPPDPNSLDIKMDPDLESAVIERGEEDVHATFNWQGGRTSEAFVIHGFCFRKVNFAFPDLVVPSVNSLNFWLNRGDMTAGASDSFPGISWYSPSTFAGTASFNGTKVFVFAADGIKAGVDTYPEANSICLDSKTLLPLYLDDGVRVFAFTYTPDPNVQIDPQGPYLDAIKNHFGHYP